MRLWQILLALIATIAVVLVTVRSCSPKDDSPLPSPNASLAELQAQRKTPSLPHSATRKFPSRVFLVIEGGELDDVLDGIEGLYIKKHISKTLQGARTVGFVRMDKFEVGRWGRSGNPGYSTNFEICLIEIGDMTNTIHLGAETRPERTIVKPGYYLGIWDKNTVEEASGTVDGENTGILSDGKVVEKALRKYLN